MATSHANVDDYIQDLPEAVRPIMTELRRRLHAAAPGAGEAIRYQMPTITLGGRYLVYFAAWKRHIGLYPIPRLDDALEAEIAPYRAAKDTVRFPLRQPLPFDLIDRLMAVLVERHASRR